MSASRSRSLLVLLGVALLTTSLTAGPAHARGWSHHPHVAARSASAAIHLTGRGNGHGHGLSQYGAQGAASRGLSARRILAFYYPGLKQGHARGNVSVLITKDTSSDVVVSDRSGLKVTALGNGRTYRLARKGASQWRITPDQGAGRSAVAYRAGRGGWHQLRTVPGQAQFTAGGAPLTLHLPHGVRVAYRGVLRSAAPSASSRRRDTVNIVALEDYLRGVVPNEAFPSWHPAALQAQAVAARTYAAFERSHPLTGYYQICDTPACQAYGGASTEAASTDAAVHATRHEVLLSGGRPAFTQYSASNGGYLAAGSEPYLVAKKDPYDTVYRHWHHTVGARAVERAFPAIGTFRSAKVLQRDGHGQWNGRVVSIQLVGSRTSTTVSGDTFRSVFGLMSTWFTLR